jgi:hypothetical protein
MRCRFLEQRIMRRRVETAVSVVAHDRKVDLILERVGTDPTRVTGGDNLPVRLDENVDDCAAGGKPGTDDDATTAERVIERSVSVHPRHREPQLAVSTDHNLAVVLQGEGAREGLAAHWKHPSTVRVEGEIQRTIRVQPHQQNLIWGRSHIASRDNLPVGLQDDIRERFLTGGRQHDHFPSSTVAAEPVGRRTVHSRPIIGGAMGIQPRKPELELTAVVPMDESSDDDLSVRRCSVR